MLKVQQTYFAAGPPESFASPEQRGKTEAQALPVGGTGAGTGAGVGAGTGTLPVNT